MVQHQNWVRVYPLLGREHRRVRASYGDPHDSALQIFGARRVRRVRAKDALGQGGPHRRMQRHRNTGRKTHVRDTG